MAIATEAPTARPFPEVKGVDVRHDYHQAGDLRMHVAEAGDPDGEPLLMLHGWPQHWYEWRYQIPVLAQHYRLIMPDLRGLGWTDAPADGYEKENMAEDIVKLLDAMGLDRVRLIAHDWGGWIGYILCLKHPKRIIRFMPLNIPHPFAKQSLRLALSSWRFGYMALLGAPRLGKALVRRGGIVRFILRQSIKRKEAERKEDIEEFVQVLQEPDPDRARATTKIYRAFLPREFLQVAKGYWRKMAPITTRTLMLYGKKDFVVRPHMLKGYKPFARDMRIENVDDAGHFVAEDQPEIVNRRALEFFAGPEEVEPKRRFDRPAAKEEAKAPEGT